ncbi:hypothetical protein ACMATS_15905 [Streptoverticillium reticulum]
MTTASMTPAPSASSAFSTALRAIKAFAGAAVDVAVLGQYADKRRA